ncbi:uncharacterized protein PITG_15134 [Phytophthora infestans T30-4]|uniref:Uncharacterized protein n=1 Tax=Phytophthora infestans (strain T30-4) TaxID=403677 RepID=D0NRR1_PHYIT|nr:uncharacterized protein PITG_15134 [Phytophthora infestans T30-4]EEY63410.1 conserved hypothetical protein [Phytophthora infestans T30-4]|eukprot:XP_002898295.1 conserved hypothetical protein [Phytophthora infestans T30-4]
MALGFGGSHCICSVLTLVHVNGGDVGMAIAGAATGASIPKFIGPDDLIGPEGGVDGMQQEGGGGDKRGNTKDRKDNKDGRSEGDNNSGRILKGCGGLPGRAGGRLPVGCVPAGGTPKGGLRWYRRVIQLSAARMPPPGPVQTPQDLFPHPAGREACCRPIVRWRRTKSRCLSQLLVVSMKSSMLSVVACS